MVYEMQRRMRAIIAESMAFRVISVQSMRETKFFDFLLANTRTVRYLKPVRCDGQKNNKKLGLIGE